MIGSGGLEKEMKLEKKFKFAEAYGLAIVNTLKNYKSNNSKNVLKFT